MSKAFTKEDSDRDDDEIEVKASASLFQGRNYITPGGLQKLQDEYKQLKFKERPEVCRVVQWAAENGDRSENADYTYGKKRLRQIDGRLRFLRKRIEAAEVIDPTKIKSESVAFGATVTVLNQDDQEKTYSIVGVDEVDVDRGRISWISPLASALIKGKEGDVIQFRSPKGLQELEIIAVKFISLDT